MTAENSNVKNTVIDLCAEEDNLSPTATKDKHQVLPDTSMNLKEPETSKRTKKRVQLKLPFPTVSKGPPSEPTQAGKKVSKRSGDDISIMSIKKKFKRHQINVKDPLLLHGYAFFGEGKTANQLYVFMRTRNNFDVEDVDEDKK